MLKDNYANAFQFCLNTANMQILFKQRLQTLAGKINPLIRKTFKIVKKLSCLDKRKRTCVFVCHKKRKGVVFCIYLDLFFYLKNPNVKTRK